MSSSIPDKIGKYTITAALGRGAMGMVYEGRDPIIDRPVAIKVIRKSAFDDDELSEALNRFKQEAQAAGKLSHPNIVMVYEYGEENDTAFIAMEYVRGRTLKEIMEDDSLTIGQVADFVTQLLDGLDYAHSHHVIHRDIKPANLVYTDEGQIKIMDFGIAKVESSSLTQAGTLMGTPAYMAPELFTGEAVDHRTDLFSTGIILYQLLTGLKPFTGATMSIIMHQVVNIYPPNPSTINTQLPKTLDTLLRKSLAKQLANRFQSAPEFKKSLLHAFKKLPQQAKIPCQADTANEQTILKSPTKNHSKASRAKWPTALKPLYVYGGATLVIIIILSLFFLSGEKEPTAETTALTPLQPSTIKANPTIKQKANNTTPIKIITPTATKTAKSSPQERKQQSSQQPSGISINGRKNTNKKSSSGHGIRITTPRRD